MPRPMVSFVIPAYNAGQTIKETLDSLDRCGCEDFEVIIIDDGSTDDTYEVAARNLRRRGKVIRTSENYGCATAINIGISEASGRYIARIDADDLCGSDRLKMQLTRLEADRSLSFCGGAVREFGITDNLSNLPTTVEQCNSRLPLHCCFPASAMTLDRERIGSVLYHDPCFIVCEDYDLWARLVMSGNYGVNVEGVCVHYRQHLTQLTRLKQRLFKAGDLQIKQKLIAHILDGDANFSSFVISLLTTRPFFDTRPDLVRPFLELLSGTKATAEFSTSWSRTKRLISDYVDRLSIAPVPQSSMSELLRFSLKAYSKGTAVGARTM